MVDEPSSLSEAVMLGAGSIEHRELIYYTVSKSTSFHPPRRGPTPIVSGQCAITYLIRLLLYPGYKLHYIYYYDLYVRKTKIKSLKAVNDSW